MVDVRQLMNAKIDVVDPVVLVTINGVSYRLEKRKGMRIDNDGGKQVLVVTYDIKQDGGEEEDVSDGETG